MGLTTEAGADYEHTYRSFFKDAEAEDSIGNIAWNIFASVAYKSRNFEIKIQSWRVFVKRRKTICL